MSRYFPGFFCFVKVPNYKRSCVVRNQIFLNLLRLVPSELKMSFQVEKSKLKAVIHITCLDNKSRKKSAKVKSVLVSESQSQLADFGQSKLTEITKHIHSDDIKHV